jgi:hypothetical protein
VRVRLDGNATVILHDAERTKARENQESEREQQSHVGPEPATGR